ncbi:MAG: hypothetical protein Q7T90_05290 [Thiobacillus sp.]|nr:hypothetical protein [Thiobacillus sp.]
MAKDAPTMPGRHGDVGHLLINLGIHLAQQRLAGEDHARHPHPAKWLDPPFEFGRALELGNIHGNPFAYACR